jgi:fructose-1,6-bisphosphatase I
LIEQAGGKSSMSAKMEVLDVAPEGLHQRIPVYLGSTSAVTKLLG